MNRGQLITLDELNQLAAECYSAIPVPEPPHDYGITGVYDVDGDTVTWRPWPPVPTSPDAA